MTTCADCGKKLKKDEGIDLVTHVLCEDCAMEDLFNTYAEPATREGPNEIEKEAL